MSARRVIAAAVLLALASGPARALAETPSSDAPPRTETCRQLNLDHSLFSRVCIREATFYTDVCRAIRTFADLWQLPPDYFARLIWQESRFDPNAMSGAGAEGIAQFMPSTGRIRGVADAYDPVEALAKSAEYLRFLQNKFGNLGLAAAAYNGGEDRIARYVAAGGYLPAETLDYVEIVTGRAVETWLEPPETPADYALDKDVPFEIACYRMAAGRGIPSLQPPLGPLQPWGVLLAQDFSRPVAVRHFERVRDAHASLVGEEKLMLYRGRNPSFGTALRYFAMIGRDTREAAETLCGKLRAAGAACIVRRNQ